MENNENLRSYILEAMSQEPAPEAGDHVAEDELIEYQQGRLGERERERVQAHLVRCAACIAAFQDVNDFFEPSRAGERPVNDVEVRRRLRAVWRSMPSEEGAGTRAAEGRPQGIWLSVRAAMMLAASVLLVVGLTGTWALRLRQEQRQLAERPRPSGLAERLSQAEQDNRRLQEQARTAQQQHESQLAELRQPRLNVPIYDILPQGSARGQSAVAPVTVPDGAPSVTLVLSGEGQAKYPSYAVEILDQSGRRVWWGEGLQRNSEGNFVLVLDRGFLPAGTYRLRVYGQAGGPLKKIADYVIALR